MAVIRVKRGATSPTTSNLSEVGEIAFDYSNNALFVRGLTDVVKIGGEAGDGGAGEMTLDYYFEGNMNIHSFRYGFHRDFIYKIRVLASSDIQNTANTIVNYCSTNVVNYNGSFVNINANDNSTAITRLSSRNTSVFTVSDGYTASVTASYGVVKVMDFEISPTLYNSLTSTVQWISKGYSITSANGQTNSPITYADFAHTFSGAFGAMRINSGFSSGNRFIAVSVYKIRRK